MALRILFILPMMVGVEQHEPTEEERIAAEKEADRLRRKRESNRKYMNCLLYTSPSPRD